MRQINGQGVSPLLQPLQPLLPLPLLLTSRLT